MVLKKKSSLTPWLIIGGIIVVVIAVAAVYLISPSTKPVTLPDTAITVPPTTASVSVPQAPACTIAIVGSKIPPSSIRLQVMTSSCKAGDITELRVSVNGAQKGILGSSPGTSGMFAGNSGTNNVIVVAEFANGAENVVYQNPAL